MYSKSSKSKARILEKFPNRMQFHLSDHVDRIEKSGHRNLGCQKKGESCEGTVLLGIASDGPSSKAGSLVDDHASSHPGTCTSSFTSTVKTRLSGRSGLRSSTAHNTNTLTV